MGRILRVVSRENSSCVVVFFVGDQLCPETVPGPIVQYQSPGYLFRTLQRKFPNHGTFMLIYPAVVTPEGFSSYSQFLPGNLTATGEPMGGTYVPRGLPALHELRDIIAPDADRDTEDLYEEPLLSRGQSPPLDGGATKLPRLPPSSIDLVGFSKGGVVLNQLLAEFGSQPSERVLGDATSSDADDRSASLLEWGFSLLRGVHYVDAGVNGRGGYLCEPRRFKQLKDNWASTHSGGEGGLFKVTLHGTWRQWADPRRPFLDEERRKMFHWLQTNSIDSAMRAYNEQELPSLKLLNVAEEEKAKMSVNPINEALQGILSCSVLRGLLAHMQCIEVFDPEIPIQEPKAAPPIPINRVS